MCCPFCSTQRHCHPPCRRHVRRIKASLQRHHPLGALANARARYVWSSSRREQNFIFLMLRTLLYRTPRPTNRLLPSLSTSSTLDDWAYFNWDRHEKNSRVSGLLWFRRWVRDVVRGLRADGRGGRGMRGEGRGARGGDRGTRGEGRRVKGNDRGFRGEGRETKVEG